MELSEKEKEVLKCIWSILGLGRINKEVGIGEINDLCSYSFRTIDDDIRQICDRLVEKGYVGSTGNDIIYTRDTEKRYLELNL